MVAQLSTAHLAPAAWGAGLRCSVSCAVARTGHIQLEHATFHFPPVRRSGGFPVAGLRSETYRRRHFAAMGKVAVRLKEVVYMVSPFEVSTP